MDAKEIAALVLPLFIIPLTLFSVLAFGHDAGNLIIGSCFLIGIARFADKKERRFMIILAVLATIFETVNIAAGSYRYIGTALPPVWIPLGWGVVGLYLLRNVPFFKRIENRPAFALAFLMYVCTWAITGFSTGGLIAAILAVAGIYALSLASGFPVAFFMYSAFMGILIESAGTSSGVWTYFGPDGAAVAPALAGLGMAYSAIIAFGLWASSVE